MNKINTRFVLGLLCGFLALLVQLYIRPTLKGTDYSLSVLLGCLPNFLATIGFSLILIQIRDPKKSKISTTSVTLAGVIAHEIFTQSTPSNSFGGTFDWNDVIASVLGGVSVYVVETMYFQRMNGKNLSD